MAAQLVRENSREGREAKRGRETRERAQASRVRVSTFLKCSGVGACANEFPVVAVRGGRGRQHEGCGGVVVWKD